MTQAVFNVGLNRPQADNPDTNWQVPVDDAVNYLVGRTGRDRGLCSSLVKHAQRTGAVFVACDRKLPDTASCVLVKA